MEEVLKQILSKLDSLEQGQKSLENKVDDRFNSLESKMNDRFNKLEKKVDVIEDHVATLTEFKIDTTQRLTAIDGGKK